MTIVPRRVLLGSTAALALVLASGACGILSGDGTRDDLEDSRQRWRASAPDAYVYAIERLCFCGDQARGPVRIRVVGRDAVERVYVADGSDVPSAFASDFPAVEGLFDIIEDAIDRNAHRIDVTYDPETGVPLDFFIDYEENTADEELGVKLTESVRATS
jgi:Family of unknown function (DUF6174)